MSMARLYYSTFAARQGKTLACEQCREPIAKGERYIWFKVGFRSRYKHVRHINHPPRDSERESGKMAGIYAARESAVDSIMGTTFDGDPESFITDIKSALEQAASDWRDVASEYTDAAEASPTGLVFGVDLTEVADSIESAADELESWDPSEDAPQACDEHDEWTTDCEDCTASSDEWASEVQNEAEQALSDGEGNIEVM